jgi:hypothetical protein
LNGGDFCSKVKRCTYEMPADFHANDMVADLGYMKKDR